MTHDVNGNWMPPDEDGGSTASDTFAQLARILYRLETSEAALKRIVAYRVAPFEHNVAVTSIQDIAWAALQAAE